MFDKRYQVSVTFFTVKHFPNRVDAAEYSEFHQCVTLLT
jgi:hypothetical protein